MERFQIRTFYLVTPLHLANQQFGIAAYAQRRNGVGRRIVQCGQKRVVFSHIVRVAAEFLGKFQDQLPLGIAYHHGICSGTRIAARGAVNIGYMNSGKRRCWMGFGEKPRAARRRSSRSSHTGRPQLSRDVEAEAPAWEADAEETLGSIW